MSSRSINGWVDTDWDDDLLYEGEHEDEQSDEHEDDHRDKQESEDQVEENYREGPIEGDDLMQSLDDFGCEQEDVQDQRCEGIITEINSENEHTNTYSPQQPTADPHNNTEWNGYKIVKDNFDKNICPSFQRINRQTLSTPYCHVYAVKDRINLSSFSNARPEINIDINTMDILPTNDDLVKLKEEFYIITSRYVCMCLLFYTNITMMITEFLSST